MRENMRGNSQLRWIFAAISVVAASVLIAYFTGRATKQGEHEDLARGTELDPASLSVPETKQRSEPLQSDQAASDERAWVVVDPETVDQLPAYKEIVPGRVLVRVSEALRRGTAGDRITLEVPQIGKVLKGVVERVDVDPHGNTSYLGLVTEADGRNYRFVITAGTRNTFAHIGSAQGTFELVATGGTLGWLMPTRFMDQHVDYTQPDYVLMEEPEPEEDVPST